MSIVIITGSRNSGKTGWCHRQYVEKKRNALKGIIQYKCFAEGECIGYDTLLIGTGARIPFLRTRGREPDGWDGLAGTGRYMVSVGGLRRIRAHLAQEGSLHPQLMLIDEIGPLELAGQGLAPVLDPILRGAGSDEAKLILVIRKSLLGALCACLKIADYQVIDIDTAPPG